MDDKAAKLFHLGAGLPGARLWGDAIDSQGARIDEIRTALRQLPQFRDTSREELEMAGRLIWEAHFLVIAMRQLLRTQERYSELTGNERLVTARADFDAAVPNAKTFRDFLEHLDEYLLNRGNLQRSGSIAPGTELLVDHARRTGRVTLRFDNLSLDLCEAAEAALQLADVTADVWFEHVMDAMKEDGGSGVIRP